VPTVLAAAPKDTNTRLNPETKAKPWVNALHLWDDLVCLCSSVVGVMWPLI